MKRDSRLSNILHALLHMAEHEQRHGQPMTSDMLATCLSTNPVVVRRTMAGLREQGLVVSEKGHGGGWRLARPLEGVTLGQVHAALGDLAADFSRRLAAHPKRDLFHAHARKSDAS